MGKERDASEDRVDGGETMGNSFGESPAGKELDGSDDRVDRGEAWEIAWGEFRWERARRKRR